MDERVDDTRAVMDAAGVDRCFMYGISEGGPMAVLFAATYPERVAGLILHATAARFVRVDETDGGARCSPRLLGALGPWMGYRGVHDVVALRTHGRRRRVLPGVGAPLRAPVGESGRDARSDRDVGADRWKPIHTTPTDTAD